MKYLLTVLLWTGYVSLHSFLISIRFTNLMIRLLKNYYAFFRLFYVTISLILLIPLINYTSQLDDKVMRHPMYLALIIYLWCQTFRVVDIVINSLLTIYVIVGTMLEERKLVLEFGDEYIKYKKEVPMLIPFTKKIIS